MNRDEFTSLPLRIALGVIYDIARTQRLVDMPMPEVPKPPLYDGRLSRGERGFVWMSEMTLCDLRWWRDAKQKSADDPQRATYADRARKAVATLDKWIAWRADFPTELWSGKRGDDRATGAAPSRDARINSWSENGSKKKSAPKDNKQESPPEEDDGGYGF